jgi:hypothetical protein
MKMKLAGLSFSTVNTLSKYAKEIQQLQDILPSYVMTISLLL